jgi:hypothetical protein
MLHQISKKTQEKRKDNTMPIRFKYTYLESDADRAYVRLKTHEIRSMLPKMEGSRVPGEDYFAIGSILLDIRSRTMPKRLFYAWISDEVKMSKGVAACYMRIVRVFRDKYESLKHVPYTTLYELTFPSYPSFILERIEAGGYVPSLDAIQEIRASKQITGSKVTLQEFQDHANLQSAHHNRPQEVQRKIEELRMELKEISDRCIKAEEERDNLVRSIRQLV